MQKDLGNYRKSYEKSELLEDAISKDPIEQFKNWFNDTEKSKLIEEPNAMTLSTISPDGYPKNRIVLLKHFSIEGLVFYTNYTSEKGKAIEVNPKVGLSFFWPQLERQVIVKGTAERVDSTTSNTYFDSRPLGSRFGALASDQSSVISSRKELEDELKRIEKEYAEKEPKRPIHWGGYLVQPISFEFWQGRQNRLHDRIRYSRRDDGQWIIERLAP